jgi:hypothetical protein
MVATSQIIVCGAKTLPRSIDLDIQVSKPQTEGEVDLSVTVFVQSSGNLPHGASRIRYYIDPDSLATDVADGWLNAEAAKAGRDFFAQSPRATTMAVAQAFDTAQAGYARMAPAGTLAAFLLIANGSFAVSIDGVSQDIVALDFTGETDFDGVASVIQAALQAIGSGGFTAATCTYLNGVITIKSGTTGDSSAVSVLAAVDPVSGTDISGATYLNGLVATLTHGYTPGTLDSELSLITEAARCSGKFIYAWDLDESYRDSNDQKLAAQWAQQRTAVMSVTSNNVLAWDPGTTSDIGSVIEALGIYRKLLIWHDNKDYYPGMAVFALMLSVNYNAENSIRNAKFSDLTGIPTSPIDVTQLTVLQSKGYNLFTAVGVSARTFRDGETSTSPQWYLDQLIGLDNYKEDLSVNLYNVWLRNKIVPFDESGVALEQDAIDQINEKYVFNGFLGPRRVLDLATKEGFRVDPAYATSFAPLELSTASERAARSGPPATINLNMRGAINTLSVNVFARD